MLRGQVKHVFHKALSGSLTSKALSALYYLASTIHRKVRKDIRRETQRK